MKPVRFEITLEPLLENGIAALDTCGLIGIRKITLRGIQFARDNAFHELTTRRADDIFRCFEAESPFEPPAPPDAILVHAFFDIEFDDSPEPRSVVICPPFTIKFERDSDAPLVLRWLALRGLTASELVFA